MEDLKKEVKDYLKNEVDPIIKPLIDELVKRKPKDIVSYIQDYVIRIKNKSQQQKDTHDSDEEQIDQKQINLLLQKKKLMKKGEKKMSGRQGISAEAFGAFNKKEKFVAKVIHKDEGTKKRIKALIENSILFQFLTNEQFTVVIDAMEEVSTASGQTIITEGEKGDSLFIIDSGQFQCFKIIDKKDTYLKTYKSGQFFGELALMYNAPRAATIKCKISGKVYALDRSTFTQIVQESATKKRKQFLDILSKVQILSEIDPYEKEQLCDSLKVQEFEAGRHIVRQGEQGDKFFIVASGRLSAQKKINGASQKVFEYKEGDYFGQIALIKNTVRQASICAETNCRVVSIDREAFKRLLGPLENILQRNMEKYKKFVIE